MAVNVARLSQRSSTHIRLFSTLYVLKIFFLSDPRFVGDDRTMIYQNDICFHVNIIAEIGRLNSVDLGSLGLCTKFGGDGQSGQAKNFRRAARQQHYVFRIRPAILHRTVALLRSISRSCSQCSRARSERSSRHEAKVVKYNSCGGPDTDPIYSRFPGGESISMYVKAPLRWYRHYGNASYPRSSAPQDF